MKQILAAIIDSKQQWLTAQQQQQPLATFQPAITSSQRDFYQALVNGKTAFILECKKASPSKGLIRADFDLLAISDVYRQYADVISVLTDSAYFQGQYPFLTVVSEQVQQPVLCKDFIIDPYQIYLARYYQADAVLLMLSVLDDQQYQQLAAVAHQLQMGVLTEVSNQAELNRALALGAKVIGINNRDLRDLSVDLRRTEQLAPQIPAGITIISESGIAQHAQVRQLSRYVNGFLVGSALMAEENLLQAVRRLLLGDNKVCGLTRGQDAKAAYQAGANYGGLIFVASSPRCVSLSPAQTLMAQAPLHYVGVFANAPIEQVVSVAKQLALHAVQLHGEETADYLLALRQQLPVDCAIWQAIDMQTATSLALDSPIVDRYLLDNGGGSGQSFNWQKLMGVDLARVMLAGGLCAENCQQAAQLGCIGLDFNSGVETSAGIKSAAKLTDVFSRLRDY